MMSTQITPSVTVASVNGVALHGAEELLSEEVIRQRACTELLRQAALTQGLLQEALSTSPDGVLSEAASAAIEAMLETQLVLQQPSDEDCARYYQGHAALYTQGEQVNARHILFAVTEGVDVNALRQRAESTLLEVRCHDGRDAERIFTGSARNLSNCPSGADGGQLGWLTASDCAPEFAKELFGASEIGVLPRLVNSRFGFHVVEIMARKAGVLQSFEAVKGSVMMSLNQQAYVTGLRQYLGRLAAEAELVGVSLETGGASELS